MSPETLGTARFKRGYREIVYSLVYPGVLASMLYDFYLLASGNQTYHHAFVLAAITSIYLLDYFHLFIDLKELTGFPILYSTVDLAISILFGLAFAFAKSDQLPGCQLTIVSIVIAMLVYSLVEKAESRLSWLNYARRRWVYIALSVLGIGQLAVSRWGVLEAYLAVVGSVYILYIVRIWRSARAEQQA